MSNKKIPNIYAKSLDKITNKQETLEEHTLLVMNFVQSWQNRLPNNLSEEEKRVLYFSALLHDLGKGTSWFQKSLQGTKTVLDFVMKLFL